MPRFLFDTLKRCRTENIISMDVDYYSMTVTRDGRLIFPPTGFTSGETAYFTNIDGATSGQFFQYNGASNTIVGASITTTSSAPGGASFWTALVATTDFSTTGASPSTITMNTDQTSKISVGTPIKLLFNGTTQYRAGNSNNGRFINLPWVSNHHGCGASHGAFVWGCFQN